MLLYKYISARWLKNIVERQRIRFTQPALFHDPFEPLPKLDGWEFNDDPSAAFAAYFESVKSDPKEMALGGSTIA